MSSAAPVLALDVGSTGLRVARFDRAGGQVGPSRAVRYRDNSSEQGRPDASALLGHLVDALRSLDLTGVEVVASSVVWHAIVALDADDEPLAPAVTWEARIPVAIRDRAWAALDGAWSHENSGAYIHSSFASASIPFLQGLGAVRFVNLGAWLVGRLAGVSVGWPENIASGSSLWDQHSRGWNLEALKRLDVAEAQLGSYWDEPITSSSPLVPELAGVSWLPVVGDGVCHNLGQRGVGGRYTVTVGTSGSLRSLQLDGDHGGPGHGLWRYRLDADLTATGGAVTSAGNVLEWAQDFLQSPISWTQLEGSPPTSSVLVDPAVFGRRGPDYSWQATGSIQGLTPSSSRSDVAQAFAIDMWRPFREHLLALREVVGDETEVVVEGGVIAHNPVALQLLADALGATVRQTTVSEPSLVGAALVGAHSLTNGFDLAGAAREVIAGRLGDVALTSEVSARPEWTEYLVARWG